MGPELEQVLICTERPMILELAAKRCRETQSAFIGADFVETALAIRASTHSG